jgi:hypothetical protein
MCIFGLAYERAIFQLLDLKIKKEFEISHHRYFKPSGHDLAKFITKRFVSRTKDYVIHIDLAYKKIFVYFSCEKSWVSFTCRSGLRHFPWDYYKIWKGSRTLEQDEHGGLRGLGYRSLIPYVHGRKSCIIMCVALFKAELNLVSLANCLVFYISRLGSYTVTQGPTGGPRVVGFLYRKTLPARSNKWCLQRRGHAWSCCSATPHY